MPLFPPTPDTWLAGELTAATKFNSNLHDALAFMGTRVVFRAWDAVGTQSIANATDTTMVLGTVLEDPYSGWTTGASNRYVAQVQGVYLAIVTCVMTGGQGAGNTQFAQVNYNTGTFICGMQYPIGSPAPEGCQAAIPIFLRVGESVGPSVRQISGAARTLSSTSVGLASAMEIMWVSK
jgi:hypothetical protein